MAENKLHALLAVESDLRKKSALIKGETRDTFTKKQEHFDGLTKTYSPFSDSTVNAEVIPPEVKEVVTTVADKISWTLESVVRAIDARASINETNASGTAMADLVLGDKTLTLSALSLLELEKDVQSLRDEVYKNIPTLDPTKTWVKDTDAGDHLYQTGVETKIRTNKINEPFQLAPATDKHQAQVQLVSKDVQVGKWETIYKSGRVTVAQKAKVLGRLDDLLLTIKQARSKANEAAAVQVKVGDVIFGFINEGVF